MAEKGAGHSFVKRILLECVLVAVCGLAIGLVANSLSPWGLRLSRNYFPNVSSKVDSTKQPGVSKGSSSTNQLLTASTNSIAQRLARRGISLVDSNYVIAAFHSAERAQNLLIFIDARDEAHYKQGHIPGAYQLDYYRPEAFLAAVLPAASVAQRIIIYCNGGECEDSEFSASLLNDAGVPPQKLMVYGGGFVEWSTNSLPVEIGAKDSQQYREK